MGLAPAGQKVVGFRITREAKRQFRYRYTCGKCGRRTEWYGGVLANEKSLEKRGGGHISFEVDEIVQLQREADVALVESIKAMEAEVQLSNTQSYEGPLPFKKLWYLRNYLKEAQECPSCGAPQPWKERSFSSAGWWTLGFFFIGLVVSPAIAILFQLDTMGIPGLITISAPIVATMLVGFFIGRHRNTKETEQYAQDIAKTARGTWLEIEWGRFIR